MNNDSTYSQIWKYLSNELSPKEEEAILLWLDRSERNQNFFNSVVTDFNICNSAELIIEPLKVEKEVKKRKNTYTLIGIAASILFCSIFLGLWFNYSENIQPVNSITLSDGTQVKSDSQLSIDINSYEKSGLLKLNGNLWIEASKDSEQILTIETSEGYFILENVDGYVENKKAGQTFIQIFKGSARFITKGQPIKEVSIASGEKLSYYHNNNVFIKSETSTNKKPI